MEAGCMPSSDFNSSWLQSNLCKHIIISNNISNNKYSYSRKTIDVLSSTCWEKMPLIVENYLMLRS